MFRADLIIKWTFSWMLFSASQCPSLLSMMNRFSDLKVWTTVQLKAFLLIHELPTSNQKKGQTDPELLPCSNVGISA